ncbi:MAG: hypothetical protein LC750_16690 [Actinobacteria bacterium]|nr:hypothetical protein [Actinomycetota bacterium]
MTLAAAVTVAGLLITVIVMVARVLLQLGAIEQQLALLWAWYLAECGPGIPGGRRRTDPPESFATLERRGAGGLPE